MSESDSLNELLAGLRSGNRDAATVLFEKYAERLIALARSRLGAQFRPKVDPEDIAQSVFKSFFRRQSTAEFTFDDWGGLWGMLVVMTLRKCGRQIEKFQAARRDVRKEIRPPVSADDSQQDWDFPGGAVTPDEAATLTETLERLMRNLDSRGQKVLSLRLQGYTVPEIGDQVGCTERTVHRALERVREQLSLELGLAN